MFPSNASTAGQKPLAKEWCTGLGIFKLTPAACCALTRRSPSFLRSRIFEVFSPKHVIQYLPFFALPQVATNVVKGCEISPASFRLVWPLSNPVAVFASKTSRRETINSMDKLHAAFLKEKRFLFISFKAVAL